MFSEAEFARPSALVSISVYATVNMVEATSPGSDN